MIEIYEGNQVLKNIWTENILRSGIGDYCAVNIGSVPKDEVIRILNESEGVVVVYNFRLHARHAYLLPYFLADKILFVKTPLIGKDLLDAKRLIQLHRFLLELNKLSDLIHFRNKIWIEQLQREIERDEKKRENELVLGNAKSIKRRESKKITVKIDEKRFKRVLQYSIKITLELVINSVLEEFLDITTKYKISRLKEFSAKIVFLKYLLTSFKDVNGYINKGVDEIFFETTLKVVEIMIDDAKKNRKKRRMFLLDFILITVDKYKKNKDLSFLDELLDLIEKYKKRKRRKDLTIWGLFRYEFVRFFKNVGRKVKKKNNVKK